MLTLAVAVVALIVVEALLIGRVFRARGDVTGLPSLEPVAFEVLWTLLPALLLLALLAYSILHG
ncbi:MAG: hypothetical protein HW416_2466 [Chloroflexi bacterium]|nr:hypothetical protein [Chloroflexota bacterium]